MYCMVTSSPLFMSTIALSVNLLSGWTMYLDEDDYYFYQDCRYPVHLALLIQEWDRKEKVGYTALPDVPWAARYGCSIWNALVLRIPTARWISSSVYVSAKFKPFLMKSTTFRWNMFQYSVSLRRSSSWSIRYCTLVQVSTSLSLNIHDNHWQHWSKVFKKCSELKFEIIH